MNIHPPNKAVNHLISSYDYSTGRKVEAVGAYLIKNSKGEGEKKKKSLSQAIGRTGRRSMAVKSRSQRERERERESVRRAEEGKQLRFTPE